VLATDLPWRVAHRFSAAYLPGIGCFHGRPCAPRAGGFPYRSLIGAGSRPVRGPSPGTCSIRGMRAAASAGPR